MADGLSESLESLYRNVLQALNAELLVDRFLSDHPDLFPKTGPLVIAGAGKAAEAMAAGAVRHFGPPLRSLLITKQRSGVVLTLTTLEAGHPVPDERSLAAGQSMLDFANACGSGDQVLFLLSGGASSLMEVLVPRIGLGDLRFATERMLRAGLDIDQLNTVRRHLSKIKSGGLSRAFGSAHVVILVLSDVAGNNLATIGSGPFVGAAESTIQAAYELARLAELPKVVLEAMLPIEGCPERRHEIVGDVNTVRQAITDEACRLGLPVNIVGTMTGEAREFGLWVAESVLQSPPNQVLAWLGETTVTVRGQGRGGRAQELALSAARVLAGQSAAVLAGSTDGSDGPTDVAAAKVDGRTVQKLRLAGLNIDVVLSENDSMTALDSVGATLRTGPTGTNLNDLVFAIRK